MQPPFPSDTSPDGHTQPDTHSVLICSNAYAIFHNKLLLQKGIIHPYITIYWLFTYANAILNPYAVFFSQWNTKGESL